MTLPRVVIDTNVLVSRALLKNSVPAQAVAKAALGAKLVVTASMLAELEEALRPQV
jgi:predicted nucleic acid-binding protein